MAGRGMSHRQMSLQANVSVGKSLTVNFFFRCKVAISRFFLFPVRKHNEKQTGAKAPKPRKKPVVEQRPLAVELPSQDELMQSAVNSILDDPSDASAAAAPLPEPVFSSTFGHRPPPQPVVKLMTPHGYKTMANPPPPSPSLLKTVRKPAESLLSVGGRQIVLSATPGAMSPTPAAVAGSSQVMVQANIGGKPVLISQDQLRKLQGGQHQHR